MSPNVPRSIDTPDLVIVPDCGEGLNPDFLAQRGLSSFDYMIQRLRQIIRFGFEGRVDGLIYPPGYERIIEAEEVLAHLEARLEGFDLRLISEGVRMVFEDLIERCRAGQVGLNALMVMMDAFAEDPGMTVGEYMRIAKNALDEDDQKARASSGNVYMLIASNGEPHGNPPAA